LARAALVVAARAPAWQVGDMTDHAVTKDMSLSEHVYATLKERLMLGHYLPGDRLSMRKLAAEFGTSPMPVREALKHLASENVIESAAAKAFHVPDLSDKRAADLFDLRALLECAAMDIVGATLSTEQIDELAALSERMDAHLKLRDFRAYMIDNQRFHFLMYRSADIPDMIAMIEQLWMKTGPSLYRGLQEADTVNLDWNSDHKRLVAAMQGGDVDRYSEILRADVRWGSEFYRE
jgi:DNA-binding GntR family transcriptional regulator